LRDDADLTKCTRLVFFFSLLTTPRVACWVDG
jgi:hypothetical protein